MSAMYRKLLIALALTLALGMAPAGAPAFAQDAAPPPADPAVGGGVVNAALLRPLPKDASFAVRPWDNSDENIKIARDIEELLRRRGHSIAINAQVVLSFSISDQPGRWGTGAQRQLFELEGTASTAQEDEMRARLNLYSSEKGGVFNQGHVDRTVRSVYTLEMIADGRDGQRLWQGEASAKLGRVDGRQLVKLMIPPLLDALGKTVRMQPFGL